MKDFQRNAILKNPNSSVAWYMMASYAYYWRGVAIISDDDFDWVGRFLASNYADITHAHKKFVSKQEVSLGTLKLQEADYPAIVKDAANRFVHRMKHRARINTGGLYGK